LSFRPSPEGYELVLAIHGDQLPAARQSMEASLAYILNFCRWMSAEPLLPLEVCLGGPAPADLAPYNQVFSAPLRFSADHYGLTFARADLERPLPTANESLAQLHDDFAGEYLARFSDSRFTHMAR